MLKDAPGWLVLACSTPVLLTDTLALQRATPVHAHTVSIFVGPLSFTRSLQIKPGFMIISCPL